MKRMMNKTKIFLMLGLITVVLVNLSCEKDKDESPDLPPSQALFIDFSDFNNPADTISSKKVVGNYYNWGVAFANVAFWNTALGIGLAVPTIAYKEALKQKPVYLGENVWEWRYSVTLSQITFIVSLQTRRVSNEEFMAAMFVSRSGPGGFNDFKWFEGTVRYDHTKAIWTIYEQPSDPAELFSVEWNYNWEEEIGDITYTNIRTGNRELGSYIKYSSDASRFFDASYRINISTGQTEIEWKKASREGRIKSMSWFKHDNWNCWDQNLMNVICQE